MKKKVYTEYIGVRVSPQMKLALEVEAQKRGMRVCDVIRYVLTNHLNDDAESSSTFIPSGLVELTAESES
jgi:hypothetical protein